MKIGQCKLCLGNKPLLKKSHIIPDWMYFGLFDAGHKMSMVDLGQKERPKRKPTGVYDPDILCEKCDNETLGVLENYGKNALCGKDSIMLKSIFHSTDIKHGDGLKSANIKVDDYISFKLFLVSLLWKMHISNNDFFKNVDLGQKHSERLRLSILNRLKIAEDEYETCIIAVQNPELILKMISTPRKIKQTHNTYYVALLNGLVFMFNVSPINKMELISKSRLKNDGSMLVPLLQGNSAKFFIDSVLKAGVRYK